MSFHRFPHYISLFSSKFARRFLIASIDQNHFFHFGYQNKFICTVNMIIAISVSGPQLPDNIFKISHKFRHRLPSVHAHLSPVTSTFVWHCSNRFCGDSTGCGSLPFLYLDHCTHLQSAFFVCEHLLL